MMENERDLKETVNQYNALTEEAIRKWDEFVTPIREYYKIPRYRPTLKDGEWK